MRRIYLPGSCPNGYNSLRPMPADEKSFPYLVSAPAEAAAVAGELAPLAAPAAPIPEPPAAATLIKVPPIARPSGRVELFNRELSWLDFNRRVLAEAMDATVPLLERLKFLAITSNNLDEFFMVRVGGIRDLISARISEPSPDGLSPVEQLREIRQRAQSLLTDMYRCLNDQLLPDLKKNGIRIHRFDSLGKKEQDSLREVFQKQIAPVLTPLALDPSHPFPFLTNLALN